METQTVQPAVRRALILEDDVWVVPIIESALKVAVPDIEIDRVASVPDAIRKTQANNYEVIVADIFVDGDQTGVNFWDDCKARCPDTAILLTSSMDEEEFQKRFSSDRDDPMYVRKPLNASELAHTVGSLLDFTGVSS